MTTHGETLRKGVGVVVGRFQTPYLHAGHIHVLNEANKHEKLVIVLGIHRAPGSFRNEMDFESRRVLLQAHYPSAMIVPMQDEKRDAYWAQKLDNLIHVICPMSPVTMYHGRMSFAPNYKRGKGKYKLVDVAGDFSEEATALREVCYGRARNSEDFRAGQFYYSAQVFPRVNPCVDLAITKTDPETGEFMIALGARESELGIWRFPGGHIDRTDENMEQTCKREAMEETHLEIKNMRYVSSRMIDDWRNTRTNGTMTTLFHCDYASGILQGGDDITVARWFPVKDLESIAIASAHKDLLEDILGYFKKLTKKE